jgi:hypothetical protein
MATDIPGGIPVSQYPDQLSLPYTVHLPQFGERLIAMDNIKILMARRPVFSVTTPFRSFRALVRYKVEMLGYLADLQRACHDRIES